MKKLLTLTALLALSASSAFAASNIATTKHNLSASSSYSLKASGQTQICVFCHTPHNATRNVPLWNRTNLASTAYHLYTTSSTLENATKKAELNADSMSIFCLSCHDGTEAELGSRVVRYSTGDNTIDVGATWNGGGINKDAPGLSNDHPIGFNYDTAQQSDTTGLRAIGTANDNLGGNWAGGKKVFFKSTVAAQPGDNSMECSSCHMVHDNSYAPFLRTSNVGSALCLACHSK